MWESNHRIMHFSPIFEIIVLPKEAQSFLENALCPLCNLCVLCGSFLALPAFGLFGLVQFYSSDIERFDFCSCPVCFPEKFKAGVDRWVMGKAADGDFFTQLFPPVLFLQKLQHVY